MLVLVEFYLELDVLSLVYNYLIVEEHGKLMYPESMAISETLVASEGGGDAMKYHGNWIWNKWYYKCIN